MELQDSIELAAGIHKVVYLIALIFSIWLSRKELQKENYAEAIWWGWTALLIVLIG